ncbi:hypothetical protein M514_01384 [Trichuris suis]|uniref:ShKT domain-containing protein n=1 Tax=Trichuris suis TaxID=68888 RepID=A0A085MKG8_9BILA|nr:hypothetical protein M513_01384 [Trichuris suis]KFD72201.1 hypothetical protein M514_01384 [Trichuris suis]
MREYTFYPAVLLFSVLFDGVFLASLDFDTSGKHGNEPHVAEDFTPADSTMLFEVMCQFCCSAKRELCSNAEACKKCTCCSQPHLHNYSNLLPRHADEQLLGQAGKQTNQLLPSASLPRQKICPCPGAQDMNELCLHWAFVGMCQRAPYMVTMCPLSCRVCC